jgi:hypothetical protein
MTQNASRQNSIEATSWRVHFAADWAKVRRLEEHSQRGAEHGDQI